jgi:hypothetical protein
METLAVAKVKPDFGHVNLDPDLIPSDLVFDMGSSSVSMLMAIARYFLQ